MPDPIVLSRILQAGRAASGPSGPPALPTENLVDDYDATNPAILHTNWQAGVPYYNGSAADGGAVGMWHSPSKGRAFRSATDPTRPTWRTSDSPMKGPCLRFVAANAQRLDLATELGSNLAWFGILNLNNWTIIATINVQTASLNNTFVQSNNNVFGDHNGYTTMGVANIGGQRKVQFESFSAVGGTKRVSGNITLNQTHTVVVIQTGGNLTMRVDGVQTETIAAGNVNTGAGLLRVGKAAGPAIDMHLGQIDFYDVGIAGAALAQAEAHHIAKHHP